MGPCRRTCSHPVTGSRCSSPSPAYLDVVIGLLRRGVVPVPLDPRLTTFERERILGGPRPHARGRRPRSSSRSCSRPPGPPRDCRAPGRCTARAAPPGRRRACGAGCSTEPRPPRCRRGARPVGLRRRRREPGALPALPLGAAAVRHGHGAGRRAGRRARPLRPGAGHRGDRRERPTSMFCVPTHLQRLFAHWDEVGRPDLSSFRLVAHAGAPCPDAVKRRLVETFPDGSTWEFYGSTEGQFTACRCEEWLERPGTVGRARPGRVLPPTRTARSGARCRRSPGSPTTATPTRRPPPGGRPPTGRRSPSATSAGSTTTATCSSTAAART